MTQPRPQDPEKFRRFRDRRRAEGLKEVRFWVADTTNPAILADLARQGALLHAAADEAGIMDWVDANWAEIAKAEATGWRE